MKTATGGITAAEVDAKMPRTFFVMRGDIQRAFGLTKDDTAVLIDNGTFVAKYPLGDARKERRGKKTVTKGPRARFVRSQVLDVARRWESTN